MKPYKVVIRFTPEARHQDFVKDFDDLAPALAYFRFVVSLHLEEVMTSFWYVGLQRGKTVYQSFSAYK